MRNGSEPGRAAEFFQKSFLPAAKKAGIGPIGIFSSVIAAHSPFLLTLLSFPSLEAMGSAHSALLADKQFIQAADEWDSGPEPPYIRMESSLLVAFDAFPQVVPPPADAKRPPRFFEVRLYESKSGKAGRKKVEMFNKGESAIFQRVGAQPVFFGQTLIGRDLPNLVYMLSYDDMAARDRVWRDFGGDPEWKKMRSMPEYADAEIVSNITNSIVRATPYSPIR
jgi:hypothetical protein